MRKLTLLLSMLFWLPGIVVAGGSQHGNLVHAAKRLDRTAQYLYQSGHDELGYSRTTRELRAFSKEASLLCELVVYGARDRDILRSYNRLLRRYDRLAYQLNHRRYGYLDQSLNRAGKALRKFDRAFAYNGGNARGYTHRRYGYSGSYRYRQGYRNSRSQQSVGYKSRF